MIEGMSWSGGYDDRVAPTDATSLFTPATPTSVLVVLDYLCSALTVTVRVIV
jgi:hypothetical protein